jgi:hypothetical protein
MIGTIDDPRIANAIGGACGNASLRVRERMDRSVTKEKQGQASTGETTFTDDLTDALDTLDEALTEQIAKLPERLSMGAPVDIRVEFTTQKAPQGEENDFGLDIGLRVIIETPGYEADKAILVQCKRMYGGVGAAGSFPKLRDDGEKQARDMLSVSPASFFFLFNAGSADELLNLMMAPSLAFPFPLWHFLAAPPSLDPGVAVLPATRVLAMSKAAKASGTKLPIDAAEVLAGAVPLGHFIATLFAPCFVGDVRTPVIQLATPPSERDLVSGLDAVVPQIGPMTKKTRRFQKLIVRRTGPKSPG